MLVNCPKCGFSQPQDQYCAKCGVDMQTYRPKPPPVSARFFANPFLHVLIIFGVVFAGALHIIREQRQQEISRRMDYLKNGPLYVEKSEPRRPPAAPEVAPSSTTLEAEVSAPAREVASNSQPPSTATLKTPGENRQAPSTAAPTGPATSPEKSETTGRSAEAAKPRPLTLRVRYALAPRAVLFRMVEASRSQGQFLDFGDFQMGTLRDAKSFINSLDVMESVEKHFANPQTEQIWFVGDRIGEQQLGLTTRIALRGFEGPALRGEIEILRNLHESADLSQSPLSKAYGPGDFGLVPQSTLLVLMTLPNVSQYDEQNFTPTRFLRLFRMPDFKQKQSEFVMLFDFE